MTIDNVKAVGANLIETPKLTKKETQEKINCVFDEVKTPKNEEVQEKETNAEVIYLKNSSYKEFLERFGRNDASQYNPGIAMGNKILHWVERGRESRDFKKIESGELEGKTVFLNKKEYKAYLKEHPDQKENTVLLKSGKGKEFVRNNAEKLGLDVRGEYKTGAEQKEEFEKAFAELKEAKKEYKEAMNAAKAELNEKRKEFMDRF